MNCLYDEKYNSLIKTIIIKLKSTKGEIPFQLFFQIFMKSLQILKLGQNRSNAFLELKIIIIKVC